MNLDPMEHLLGRSYGSARLEALPWHIMLGACCSRCHRTGPVDRLRIDRRWPTECMDQLERRLRCIDCHNAEANRFTVFHGQVKGPDKFRVDLYSEGSTIYRLDAEGKDLEIVAWARSSLVARAAFLHLLKEYASDQFMQRRRSWIEGDGQKVRDEERLAAKAAAKAG